MTRTGDGGREPLAARIDRATLGGLALGIAVMLQPVWAGGFRTGFFFTLVMVVGQIVASHLVPRRPE
jgi:hypothetical protein